jgi:hypothetical protein
MTRGWRVSDRVVSQANGVPDRPRVSLCKFAIWRDQSAKTRIFVFARAVISDNDQPG